MIKIELWAENKLYQTTQPQGDSDEHCQIAADKIANAARKHGITLWFED